MDPMGDFFVDMLRGILKYVVLPLVAIGGIALVISLVQSSARKSRTSNAAGRIADKLADWLRADAPAGLVIDEIDLGLEGSCSSFMVIGSLPAAPGQYRRSVSVRQDLRLDLSGLGARPGSDALVRELRRSLRLSERDYVVRRSTDSGYLESKTEFDVRRRTVKDNAFYPGTPGQTTHYEVQPVKKYYTYTNTYLTRRAVLAAPAPAQPPLEKL